ncbi:MAG: hypothetical protein KDE31_33610 [Caldilineaceae bacterium]|nr:hypothetical protein [Caldilineaceae bacterium]
MLTNGGGYDLSRNAFFAIDDDTTGIFRTEPLLADNKLLWISNTGWRSQVYIYTKPILRD